MSKRFLLLAVGALCLAASSGGCHGSLPRDGTVLAHSGCGSHIGIDTDGQNSTERDLDVAGVGADAALLTGPISTVAAPEAQKRPIGLRECIALALENGRTGEFFDRAGTDRHTSASALQQQAAPSSFTDSIRVFAFDPAILTAEIEESLSKFDARWLSHFAWNRTDRPGLDLSNAPPGFAGIDNLGVRFDDVQLGSSLLKPLPTGGVAGITFVTDYQRRGDLPFSSSVINPGYRPALTFGLEQPLLQGAGVLINQIRDAHPGSVRHPLAPGPQVPGILIARVARDQAQLEFQRRVQDLLFTVEDAFWDLYCAYWDLYSREVGMKQTHAAWQIAKARYDAGGIGIEELAQIEEQFHSYRTQRLEALGRGTPGRPGVLEAERRLRYVVGLPPEDGVRLIPADIPETTPLVPDWNSSFATALAKRPELLLVEQEIRLARLAIIRANDLSKPDLRFISQYNLNSLGRDLGDGLRELADRPHHDWEVGLQLQMPIGFREGRAEMEKARLRLAQRYAFLRDQQAKVVLSLQRSYRDVVQFREEMQTRRDQQQAAATQLKARYEKFKAGRETIDLLLRAQRNWADALRDEYIAVCNYNVALADLQRQQGTIMENDQVTVVEGSLPACAQERASEHIRKACREKAASFAEDNSTAHPQTQADTILPKTTEGAPAPIPNLLEENRNLPERLNRDS